MKLILLIMLLSLLGTLPFLLLRKPWALKLWRRVHMLIIVYAVVIAVAAAVGLVFRWDDIYG